MLTTFAIKIVDANVYGKGLILIAFISIFKEI